MRTSLRRTSTPASVAASATSMIPTEPKSRPSPPARRVMTRSRAARSSLRRVGAHDLVGGLAFELGTALLESREVALGGRQRLALGNQVVPGIAGLHVHAVAEPPKARDPLQQNYLHSPLPCRVVASRLALVPTIQRQQSVYSMRIASLFNRTPPRSVARSVTPRRRRVQACFTNLRREGVETPWLTGRTDRETLKA